MTGDEAAALVAQARLQVEDAAWSVRSLVAQRLAPFAGHAEIDVLLRRLLLDEHDTRVTLDTAEAVLQQGTLAAVRLVTHTLAEADGDTRNHLGDAVVTVCLQTADDQHRALRLCTSLAQCDDVRTAAGVQQLQHLLRTGRLHEPWKAGSFPPSG